MSDVDSRFNEVVCPAAEALYLFSFELLLAEQGLTPLEPERVTAVQAFPGRKA